MRTVKIRPYNPIFNRDGTFCHHEEEISYEDAEEFSGQKLDRRMNYMIIDGNLCHSVEWSSICTGCDGAGCRECGGHGVCRNGQWVHDNH